MTPLSPYYESNWLIEAESSRPMAQMRKQVADLQRPDGQERMEWYEWKERINWKMT